jgi:hypothetical protein
MPRGRHHPSCVVYLLALKRRTGWLERTLQANKHR